MNKVMKVIWHKQASTALRKTAAYIRKQFGLQVRENFRNEVDHVQMLLMNNPYIGSEELLLDDRTIEYRSFVIKFVTIREIRVRNLEILKS